MKDINKAREISRTLLEGLHKIDPYPPQGKFKVWSLHYIFIPTLSWLLLVNEIATSTVESLAAKINKYTRKLLGLPLGLFGVALYCRQAKLK